MALNQEYLKYIQREHPTPDRFNDFVSACQTPLRVSIRLSGADSDILNFKLLAKHNDWQLTSIPWCDNAYWIDTSNERSLGNHVAHLAGLFYIQEAASTLPVSTLFHDFIPTNVLDMAAAPGSKTTQIASHLPSTGSLVANDMSATRLKMLNANLIRMGVANYGLLNMDASHIKTDTTLFDGILLDAPCGGEGTIRKDPKAWENWSKAAMQQLANVQSQLLENAWQLLAPGGRIVYSTCTLSSVENQQVVARFLDSHDANIIKLDDLFEGADKANDKGMLHLWPEIYDTQGFFVAVLQKSGEFNHPTLPTEPSESTLSNSEDLRIRDYYQQHFNLELPEGLQLRLKSNKRHREVWLVPEQTIYKNMPRLQRLGIKLCQLIESRQGPQIKTHHEFIRCYGSRAQSGTVELSDKEAVTFFQGKNLNIADINNLSGEVLLKYQGRCIGLAKALGNGKLKNQLPRELVHDNAWA